MKTYLINYLLFDISCAYIFFPADYADFRCWFFCVYLHNLWEIGFLSNRFRVCVKPIMDVSFIFFEYRISNTD